MTSVIQAQARDKSGKGAARAARRSGMVPAVIYGGKADSLSVSLDGHHLFLAMMGTGFYSHAIELDIDGKKQKVLARDVQAHPVTGKPLHVDFLRYDPKREISVYVPVELTGTDDCPGIKDGGVAQLAAAEIEVVCRADNIPERLVVSIAALELGGSIHSHDIALPEGVRFADEAHDFTVASILATRVAQEEETEAATDAEGTAEAAEPAAEAAE